MLGTVLIVDKDVQIRRQLRRYVIMSGVRATKVLECDNGTDALHICQMEQVSLVLTELELKQLDGRDFVREISRMKEPPLVVVISQRREFEDAVEMLRLGVKDYLSKPVNREQVFDMLQKMDEELAEKLSYQEYRKKMHAEHLQRLLLTSDAKEAGISIAGLESSIVNALGTPYLVICGLISEEQLRGRDEILLNTVNEEHQNVLVVSEKDAGHLLEELRNCVVGISMIHRGVSELSKGYAESWQARKQAYFLDRTYQFDAESTALERTGSTELENTDIHPVEQAVNMIGTDRLEDAVNMVLSIIEQVRRGEKQIGQFELIVNYFVSHADRVYQHVIHEIDDAGFDIQNLYDYQNSGEYQKNLIGWMYQLNSVIENRFGDYKNKQKIQQALNYIHENFQTNLNMAVVTNYVSMNYSLFSHSFKQYTGSNFVDYLKNLRIEEAKKLLAETDMLIMDVSRSVGYDNEKHFTKVFKAECGISPSEYRKNILYGL